MTEYHKIQTVFKRDPATRHKTLLDGDYSLPEFEYLKDNMWVFTEKVDGTNIRVIFEKSQGILFQGKTDDSQIPATLVARLQNHFLPQLDKFAEIFGESKVCLYGEGYGAKIQKGGGNYRPDQDFVLFDVNVDGWWLSRENVEDIASKLDVNVVPIIGEGTLSDMINMTKAGFESQWGPFLAEGIVARLKTELKTRSGERIITKIKYKDFLR